MLQDGAVWRAEDKAGLKSTSGKITQIPLEPLPSTSKSSIVEVHVDFNEDDIDYGNEDIDIRI